MSRGALTQITAGALLGDFGRGPLAAAEDFFERGLVHLVASDAHSLVERPPRLAAARRWAERWWGEAAAREIFEAIKEDFVRFEEPSDDISLVVIKRTNT